MSIYDNVLAGYALNGVRLSKTDKNETVERCLRNVALWDEVKDVLNKKGTFLSGGQQQRLCIALSPKRTKLTFDLTAQKTLAKRERHSFFLFRQHLL